MRSVEKVVLSFGFATVDLFVVYLLFLIYNTNLDEMCQ